MMIAVSSTSARSSIGSGPARAASSNAERGGARLLPVHCDTTDDDRALRRSYGEQQMVTALIFAHDRWGSTTTIDYETEAL